MPGTTNTWPNLKQMTTYFLFCFSYKAKQLNRKPQKNS